MSGTPGKSGGARPGAGRKPKEKPTFPAPASADDALKFLLGVMNDANQDPRLRVKAAIAAAQYTHVKKGEGGKKEEKADAAKKAADRFSAPVAPKLIVNNK